MAELCVNVDHIATLREARKIAEPDPVAGALIAELTGAKGITIHVREDRRHIQERDLALMRQVLKTKLNLEMAAEDEMVRMALHYKPDMVTLVPEKRQEVTTEGGLDVNGARETISQVVKTLQDNGIPVSLFIDPDRSQVDASRETGAAFIELHTGAYSVGTQEKVIAKELSVLQHMSNYAASVSLRVNAGHGLNYRNVQPVAAIPEVEDLNIGHSIISHALLVGMERAVGEMLNLITSARGS